MSKNKSESIYKILERGTAAVTSEQDEFEVNLPAWFPKDITKDEVERLDESIRFGLIAAGLQQALIQVRQKARAAWIKGDDVNDAVASYIVRPPSKVLTEEEKMMESLDKLDDAAAERMLEALRQRAAQK